MATKETHGSGIVAVEMPTAIGGGTKSLNTFKPSNYNYFIKYNDKDFFGYNFLYRSILRIPATAFAIVEKALHSDINESDDNQLPHQWIEALKDCCFLIRKDIDELSLIKVLYNKNLYANDSLSLVLLPTLWCNFACPYCNEFKKPIFMDKKVEDALLFWIEKKFNSKRFINIGWFGGEPLLGKETIFRLTERIQEFSNKIGAKYSSSLTTNGFYLDEEIITSLKDLGIRSVQVTLDGDRFDHDKLRRQRNGDGSFEHIFDNIVSFCDSDLDCQLVLRVNCCDDNYEGIDRLLRQFPSTVVARSFIFFRWIYPDEANGYRDFVSRKQTELFSDLARLYTIAQSLGWRTLNPHFMSPNAYCEVDYLDHYTIDPNGNIFLCTHSFKESESIGSLLKEDQYIESNSISKYMKWYSINPFDDSECIACKLLPVCEGGCRRLRMETGRRVCIEERDNLNAFTKNIIDEHFNSLRCTK